MKRGFGFEVSGLGSLEGAYRVNVRFYDMRDVACSPFSEFCLLRDMKQHALQNPDKTK